MLGLLIFGRASNADIVSKVLRNINYQLNINYEKMWVYREPNAEHYDWKVAYMIRGSEIIRVMSQILKRSSTFHCYSTDILIQEAVDGVLRDVTHEFVTPYDFNCSPLILEQNNTYDSERLIPRRNFQYRYTSNGDGVWQRTDVEDNEIPLTNNNVTSPTYFDPGIYPRESTQNEYGTYTRTFHETNNYRSSPENHRDSYWSATAASLYSFEDIVEYFRGQAERPVSNENHSTRYNDNETVEQS